MEFMLLILWELLLLIFASAAFFGGARGLIIAGMGLSLLNWAGSNTNQFLYREGLILIGICTGCLLFYIVKRKLAAKKIVGGLIGSFIALIIFGAFFNPVIALIGWFLIVGVGLIPLPDRTQLIWMFVPVGVRVILGLGVLLFGNYIA